MTGTFGRSIRLFLTDGTATGVITAQVANWTGKIVVGRSLTLPDLLARPEVKQPGVYVLQGPDPESLDATRIYIGEGEVVASRLAQHARSKDFWEIACVITVSDESLTKGHIQYLESRLIELAIEGNRVHVENATNPSPTKKPLPEADRADMEQFLHNLKTVLPVVGFDFLKPRPVVRVFTDGTADIGPAADAVEAGLPIFELSYMSGKVLARAMEIDDEFVVLEGSKATTRDDFSWNSYASKRMQLISDGALKLDKEQDVYFFTQDVPFSSPSAASAVVVNHNVSGRTTWKHAADGTTYGEWQEARRLQIEEEQAEGDREEDHVERDNAFLPDEE